MKLSPRSPEYFTDNNGERCASLRLANTARIATLYVTDLHRLVRAGISYNWSINSNGCGLGYVRAKVPGDNTRIVARLIGEADAGQQVAYRDGNRLNLRRDNLLVTKGGTARVDCAALLEGCATDAALSA